MGTTAMVLGIAGMAVSLLGGLWAVRLVTDVGGFADDVASGVGTALARVEDRLGAASQGRDSEETEARLEPVREGFLAAADAADNLASHPLISILPVDDEALQIAVGEVLVEDARDGVEEALSSAAAGLGAAEEALDDFQGRLRFWVGLAAFLLVLVAVWSAWAQYHLAGWGWRAWRANPPEE